MAEHGLEEDKPSRYNELDSIQVEVLVNYIGAMYKESVYGNCVEFFSLKANQFALL